VLTDGTHIICARCGNRVSMEALGPDRPQEPAAEEFEQLGEPVAVAVLSPADPSHPRAIVSPQLHSSPSGGPIGPNPYGPLVSGPGPANKSDQSGTDAGANVSLGPSPGAGPDQEPTSDPGSTSDSGPGGNSGQTPDSASDLGIGGSGQDLGSTSGSGAGSSSGQGSGESGPDPSPNSGPDPGLEGPGGNPAPGSGLDLSLPPWPWLEPNPGVDAGPGSGPGRDSGPGTPPDDLDPGSSLLDPEPPPLPAPEPSTLVLSGLGAAGWYFTQMWRRSRARRRCVPHG